MQGAGAAIEREARHRLPRLLAELLEEPEPRLEQAGPDDVSRADLVMRDGSGRLWLFDVKDSSRPARVVRAAEQLSAYGGEGVIPVLVVPFMSAAGAATAARVGLNWIDLSGNAHVRAGDLHWIVQGRSDDLRSRSPVLTVRTQELPRHADAAAGRAPLVGAERPGNGDRAGRRQCFPYRAAAR